MVVGYSTKKEILHIEPYYHFQGLRINSTDSGTQITLIKDGSPSDVCGKVEEGDEIVQVNYQTVVSAS